MSRAILARIRREGPVHARLNLEDYHYLKERFTRILRRTGPRSWDAEDRLIALGFLRGYTLYREIPVNERQFWRHFLREVRLDQDHPTPRQFDEIWDALRLDERTRPYLVTHRGRRMLVQTIDRIWGVKGLRAEVFGELLKRFLELRASHENVVFEALLESFPELVEVGHHGETYLRIFEGFYRLLEVLKREPELAWEYLSGEVAEEDFLNELEGMGLVFSPPHPLAYVRHKSERLLRELLYRYAPLGGGSPGKPRAGARHGRRRPPPVLVRVLSVTGLPGLESVQIVPDIDGRSVYREGRRVAGEVRLEPGEVRARFHWRPKLDEQGEPIDSEPIDPRHPEGERGEVVLGHGSEEVRVRFLLRPRYVLHLELTGFDRYLDWQRRSAFRPRLKGAPGGRILYRLRSSREEAEELGRLRPRSDDWLEIVYRYHGEDTVLETVPLRFAPLLRSWKAERGPDGVTVELDAELPANGRARVRLKPAGGEWVEEVLLPEDDPKRAFFKLPPLAHAEVELRLEPGDRVKRKSLPPRVDWRAALAKGVGVGTLPPPPKEPQGVGGDQEGGAGVGEDGGP